MTGLLVLLNSHNGSEDVALLAHDLDLEVDEVLPSLESAQVLGLLKIARGKASLTELGERLVRGTIRERKAIVRDQLKRTAPFRTLLRALEDAPNHCLSDGELNQIVAFTTAANEGVPNIVNWGRYANLFRYDADRRRLVMVRRAPAVRGAANQPSPCVGPAASLENAPSEPKVAKLAVDDPPETNAAE